MSFVPAHQLLGSLELPQLAFVLHGILGSAQNQQGFVRKLQAVRPNWCFVLVEIRGHGASRGAPGPHSVQACAQDLVRLAEQLGRAPRALIGHSFGGKVCLQYGQTASFAPEQLWLLDSNPGPVSLDDDSEVRRVIEAARSVPQPIVRRGDVATALREHGLPERIASWMTTNVRQRGEHYEWLLDFAVIDELLADYGRLDFWPFLASVKSSPVIHWVIGEQSDRIGAAEIARARALPSEAQVDTHILPQAGHWVHVDNPAGLIELMAAHFLH